MNFGMRKAHRDLKEVVPFLFAERMKTKEKKPRREIRRFLNLAHSHHSKLKDLARGVLNIREGVTIDTSAEYCSTGPKEEAEMPFQFRVDS